MGYRDKKSALARRVKYVFRDTPDPGEDLTNVKPTFDAESADVAREFRGKHWRDLTYAELLREPAALCFLSPAAFRFFLPGYLLLALQDREEMDVSFDSLLSSLAGPTFVEDRLGPLSKEQLTTVLAVLEELSPQDPEDVEYWDFEQAKDGVLDFLTRPDPPTA